MTLSPCRECGQSVSTEAATCPHCGAVAPTPERQAAAAAVVTAAHRNFRRGFRRDLGKSLLLVAAFFAVPILALYCIAF